MYKEYYQEFRDETNQAISSYLFWRLMKRRAMSEPELLKGLNRAPTSWILVRHSMQVTTFITLGRIFDEDANSFSADALLKICISEINLFSKESLRSRKIANQGGVKPIWLDEYIENAYEPSQDDFHRMRGELRSAKNIFDKVYKPIRHKLIAHNDKDFIGNHDLLWKNTSISEFEGVLWVLDSVEKALLELYENGRKPVLSRNEPDCSFYENDFNRLLDSQIR